MHANLDPAHFPDSPHARELRGAGPRLRFTPELERDFVHDRIAQVHLRVRAVALTAVLLTLAYGLEKHLRDADPAPSVLLHFALLVPVTGALLYVAFSSRFRRWYPRAAWLLAPALAAVVAGLSAESVVLGAPEDLAVAVLMVIAAFLFMGLRFHVALLTGATVLLAFVLVGLLLGIALPLLLKSVVLLASAGGLAALICRDVELFQRRRWLTEALLGELVERDGLTGLQNRRALDDQLRRLWQHGLRDGRNLGVLLIDLDFFKAYNDAYGHQAGDDVLRRVARTLRGFAKRPLDLAARYGGEELCVLLFDVAPAHVADTAERLRAAVEALQIEHTASGCSACVTVSVGAAVVLPAPGRTPEGVVQLADEALYRAKAAGRNRCEVVGESEYSALITGQFGDVRRGRVERPDAGR